MGDEYDHVVIATEVPSPLAPASPLLLGRGFHEGFGPAARYQRWGLHHGLVQLGVEMEKKGNGGDQVVVVAFSATT